MPDLENAGLNHTDGICLDGRRQSTCSVGSGSQFPRDERKERKRSISEWPGLNCDVQSWHDRGDSGPRVGALAPESALEWNWEGAMVQQAPSGWGWLVTALERAFGAL